MAGPMRSSVTTSTLRITSRSSNLNGRFIRLPAISHVSFHQEPELFFSTPKGSTSSTPFGPVSVPASFRFLLRLLTLSGGNTVYIDFAPSSMMLALR